jgi:sugar (pentulose or hexulose) kinase
MNAIGHPIPDDDAAASITRGDTALGIEFGSTRIKATLIAPDGTVIGGGAHAWENEFDGRYWTYPLEAIWDGLRACYADLARTVRGRHGVVLERVGARGVSAMMHGYLPLDEAGDPLVPFRTWRNTNAAGAAAELSADFEVNIPARWSAAHLYQAVLDGEAHLPRTAHLTTLAGYVHYQLTGQRVLGAGDAAGVFPLDATGRDYDRALAERFDARVAGRLGEPLLDLLPPVAPAGESAGQLTPAGALLLDPTGRLQPGVPLCPPEGDAGTGLVATGALTPGSGNVSVGTSIFASVVVEAAPPGWHPEIDIVATPCGRPVAMVHCNNGASELGAWCEVFRQAADALGAAAEPDAVFAALFGAALAGEPDAGGLTAFNTLSGEPILGLDSGRPLCLRDPDSRLTLANFIRAQLFAAFTPLSMGLEVLADDGVTLDRLFAHGGVFRTEGVAERLLAAAIGVPISVEATASEGGPWGMALLAAYARWQADGQSLAAFVSARRPPAAATRTADPDPVDVAGFKVFRKRFEAVLPVVRALA